MKARYTYELYLLSTHQFVGNLKTRRDVDAAFGARRNAGGIRWICSYTSKSGAHRTWIIVGNCGHPLGVVNRRRKDASAWKIAKATG